MTGTSAHEASLTCHRVTAARHQRAVTAESWSYLRQTFSTYVELLKAVRQFKYLGRAVSYDNDDTPAVSRNIKKARWTGGKFRKVFEKKEVPS